MSETDDDDATFVNTPGTSSRAESGDAKDRRSFPRPRFRTPSLLTMDSGAILKGTTENVSYQGIRFQPALGTQAILVLQQGEPGTIRISLNPLLDLNACCVDFYCVVVRTGSDSVALQIQPSPSKKSADQPFPKVYVRRSSGILEPGWELLPQNVNLPEDVQKRIRHHEKKYAAHGPVAVVCRKRGDKPGDDLYKLHNIQYLKEIQEFATRDQDPGKVYDPPTGWS